MYVQLKIATIGQQQPLYKRRYNVEAPRSQPPLSVRCEKCRN